MYLVSFIIGLMIVIGSILLIRSELNRAVRSQTMLLQQSRVYKDVDLFELLESLQSSIDEMNRAFYDIAGDLEGKYSIHEKEIQMLSEKTGLHLSKLVNQEKKIIGIEKSMGGQSQPVAAKSVKDSIEHMNLMTAKALQPEHNLKPLDQFESARSKDETRDRESETLTKIINLRSQGKTLPQIAKELGIGMGELQLLISLKK